MTLLFLKYSSFCVIFLFDRKNMIRLNAIMLICWYKLLLIGKSMCYYDSVIKIHRTGMVP